MLHAFIKDLLGRQLGVDVSKLADPSAKMHDLGLDSLGLVEMLFEVEDKYGFHVEEPARYGRMTLDELVADLEATIKARHGGVVPATIEVFSKPDA